MAQLRGYHRSHSDSLPPTERAYRRAARELRDFHRTRSLDVILEEDGHHHHHHHHPAGVGGGTAGRRDDDDDDDANGMTMMRTGSLGSRSRGLKKNKCASMCLADMAVEESDSVDHDDASQEEEDEASSQHSDHHHQHHPHSWGHFIEDDHLLHDHSGDDVISRRHLLPSAGRGSYRIGLFHHRASGREKHLPQGFGQS